MYSKSCPPVLVQRPAVELPGQLSIELWLISVLYWVCGQLLTIKAHLDHQTESGTLWEVTTSRRKDSLQSNQGDLYIFNEKHTGLISVSQSKPKSH